MLKQGFVAGVGLLHASKTSKICARNIRFSIFETSQFQRTVASVSRQLFRFPLPNTQCILQHGLLSYLPVRFKNTTNTTNNSPKPVVSKIKKAGHVEAIQKHISPLTSKRPARKKIEKDQAADKDVFGVTAYATAEEIHLESLKMDLDKQGLYAVSPLPNDLSDSVFACARYQVDNQPREFFVYREGAVVFWNVPTIERQEILKFLHKHQEDSYSQELVWEEKEKMDFSYTESSTNLSGDEIRLRQRVEEVLEDKTTKTSSEDNPALEKYAFSNALSLSVKLSIWEASLSQYVDSIEWVTEDLKKGRQVRMSRADVMKKTGELFTLRHLINLSSDLLDTPDFYWDRPELEGLYQKTCSYLNISRRTRIMNEKLNYCCELAELLTTHLNDQHHTRLEWMIIVLILVEVLFEFVRTLEKEFERRQSPGVHK